MLELVRANVQRVAGLALLVLGGLIAAACAGGEPPSLAPPATEALPRSAGAFYQAPASTPVPIPEPSYLSEVIPPCTPIEGFTGDTCTPSLTSLSADASYDFGSEPFDLSRFLVGGVGTPLWTAHFVVRATTVPNTIRCETSDRPFRFPAYARDSALESGRHTVDCYVDVRVNEYLIGSGPEYLTLLVAYAFHHGEEQRQAIEQAFVGGSETGDLISLWRVRDGGVRAWEGIFFIAPSSNGAIEAFEVSASWHLQEDNDDTVRAIHPHADAWSKYPEIYEQHRDTLLEPTLATLKAGIIAANEVRMEANGGLIAPTTETGDLGENAQWPMLLTDANDLRQHYIDIGEYDDPNGPPETPLLPCGMGAVEDQVDNHGLMQDCSTLLSLQVELRGTASLNWAVDEDIDDWDGVTLSSGDDDKRVVTLDLEDESLTGTLGNRLGELTSLTTLKLANNSLTGHIPATLADLELDELKLSGNSFVGCIPSGLRDVANNDLGSLGLGDCLTPPPDADSTLEFTSTAYTFSVAEDAAVGTAVGSVQASDTNPTRTLTYTIIMGNAAGKFAVGGANGTITVAAELDYETRQQYTLTVNANNGAGGNKTTTVTVNVTDVAEDAPPAPSGLAASLTAGTFTISWTALDGAAKYEAQHTTDAASAATVTWTALPETTEVRVTYTPEGGPACSTEYRFRVRAYGDGDAYTEMWGVESAAASVETATCDPEFGQASYTFEVAEDAGVGDTVGTVSATDADEGDTLTYSITGGNEDGNFAIDAGAGAITVAVALDYETTSEYTLTVEVSDGNGGSDTAAVTVTVIDVAEDPPPAPSGLGATLADGTFTISWTALDGAAKYEAQHTTDAADAAAVTWTALPETTGVRVTYVPDGGPACSTEYRFRVRAYGNGTTYTEMWGAESDAESVETATCDPEFGQEQYVFYLDGSSAVSSSVGAVAATDPDEGDTLTYSITAGNDAGKFAVDASGNITLAATVAIAVKPFYILTVQASDGNGGTDTVEVEVGLTITECSNGTVVRQPEQQPWLVRDCSVLLTAKDALRGGASLNWSADLRVNDWPGIYLGSVIITDDEGFYVGRTFYVKDVIAARIGLNGSIPAVLAGLRDLRRLDLDSQRLTGGIPVELGQLERLEQLHIFGNRLTGSIPVELGDLKRLEVLSLYANDLTGAIPPELGRLTELEQLLLDDNDFTGQLPSELANIAGLERLLVRESRLTGSIPAWLASLVELEYLYLEGNDFTGCIPAGLRDVENHDFDRMSLPDCSQ